MLEIPEEESQEESDVSSDEVQGSSVVMELSISESPVIVQLKYNATQKNFVLCTSWSYTIQYALAQVQSGNTPVT